MYNYYKYTSILTLLAELGSLSPAARAISTHSTVLVASLITYTQHMKNLNLENNRQIN